MPRRLQEIHENRLMVVLGCLTILIAIHPIFEHWPGTRVLFHVMLDLVLLAGLLAVSRSRRTYLTVLLVGLPAFLIFWIGIWTETTGPNSVVYDVIRYLLLAIFSVIIAGHMLNFVLAAGSITVDKLCGAISVYVIIGMIGGLLFSVIDVISHSAISIDEKLITDSQGMPSDNYNRFTLMFYLSFVTLTTTGFGDMAPVSGTARVLAFTLAVVGQLYLTILVARLVGLHITSQGLSMKDDTANER